MEYVRLSRQMEVCLLLTLFDTPAVLGLESELVSNSNSSSKLTLALEVFGWKG
jgi:hypothetical protein